MRWPKRFDGWVVEGWGALVSENANAPRGCVANKPSSVSVRRLAVARLGAEREVR